MSRFLIATVSLLLGLAIGGAGIYFWPDRNRNHHGDPPAAAPEQADQHEGHDEAAHADALELSAEAIREYGIETAEAAGGTLETVLTLPAEIALDADRVAHVVPRVHGIVREVRKTLGDTVAAGEILAVMESRELAEAKAADLSAEGKLKLAEGRFNRVEGLWKQKLSSEQQYQEVLQALEEARIAHRETSARLHAFGLAHDQANAVPGQDDADFSRYELQAPFAATIVERHAALGEVRDSSSDVFVLADLSNVWVDITVYSQDAARVRPGAPVRVQAIGPDGHDVTADGTITYVSPLIRESTRTGLARAVIANEKGFWKPGLFVTAQIITDRKQADVVVPNEAIQTIENRPAVFVADHDRFQKRVVMLDKSDQTHSEIKSGLKAGERYVAKGAFVLKAELNKGTGEHED